MRTRDKWAWACLISVAIAGCDDPPEQDRPPGFDLDAMVPAGDGSSPDGGAPDGAAPSRTGPAFAVLSSDFTSTSISILDVGGKLLADDYVTSGTVKAGLVTALSGDVELPTRSGESGTLVLLDRLRTDVVTRIQLATGNVLGQVKTHTPAEQASSTSYSSNPQDYVLIDPQTAWVTRSEPNLDPAAPEIDRGNDLLRIDPSTMQRGNERIDLAPLNTTGTPAGASAAVTLYARPTRVVRVGRTLVVGIARTPFDLYNVKLIGDGAVALVDLDSKVVTPVALAGFKNCTGVSPVPNDADSVLVTCSGDYNATTRDTAGLVLLGVANGAATIEHAYRAKDDASSPDALTSAVVSLGGTLAVAAANVYAGSAPDVLAVVDLASGKKTAIVSAAPGTGRFGTAAFDAATGMLLVADSSVDGAKKPTSGVRRFQRNADNTFSEQEVTRVSVATGMPARFVYPL